MNITNNLIKLHVKNISRQLEVANVPDTLLQSTRKVLALCIFNETSDICDARTLDIDSGIFKGENMQISSKANVY